MTRILFVSLLCVSSAGHTQDSSELSALTFWARPLTEPAPSVDSHSAFAPPTADESTRAGRSLDAAGPLGDGQQTVTRAELSDAVEDRLDAVRKEESLNGERSTELIGHLTSLAALYQDLGEPDSAISALEDAIRIARINFGLYSLDQAGLVESLVASREAKGEYGEVGQQREYLRELVRRNADDPQVVGILSRLAESEMDSARRLLDVPAPTEVSIDLSGDPGLTASPRQKPALRALYAARSDYIDAIQAAVRTRTGNTQDLFALEDALVDTVYFEFAHPDLHGPHSPYARLYGAPMSSPISAVGMQLLGARVHDSVSFGRTPVEVAKALVELGDWLLIFAQNGTALDEYQVAHDLLVERSVPVETIDEIFSPEIPPALPVIPASIEGAGEDRVYRGYIDASVEINRFGIVKDVDILEESAETSKDIEKGLRHYLSSNRFRPRFVKGELARSDRFAARFYFDY